MPLILIQKISKLKWQTPYSLPLILCSYVLYASTPTTIKLQGQVLINVKLEWMIRELFEGGKKRDVQSNSWREWLGNRIIIWHSWFMTNCKGMCSSLSVMWCTPRCAFIAIFPASSFLFSSLPLQIHFPGSKQVKKLADRIYFFKLSQNDNFIFHIIFKAKTSELDLYAVALFVKCLSQASWMEIAIEADQYQK